MCDNPPEPAQLGIYDEIILRGYPLISLGSQRSLLLTKNKIPSKGSFGCCDKNGLERRMKGKSGRRKLNQ